jgi:DNA-binding MarR family transcriptional regulator
MLKSFVEKSVVKRIHILYRLSMMNVRNEMKKLGFGSGDYGFLAMLFIQDGLSQDEISKQMRVDKSYTARAIAKLEKAGMVERRPDPNEHRIRRVFLGEKAFEIEPQFVDMLQQWHSTLIEGVNPDELSILCKVLDQMKVNAETHLEL